VLRDNLSEDELLAEVLGAHAYAGFVGATQKHQRQTGN
jgi:hypothetical protein